MKTVKVNNISLLFFSLILAIFGLLSTANAQSSFTNLNSNLFKPNYNFNKPILNSPISKFSFPTVKITSPANDSGINDSIYAYDGYDEAKGMWYTDVTLKGTATEGNGDSIASRNVKWSTTRSDLQTTHLGNGQVVHVRLYSNSCFGTEHVIVLSATDRNGYTVSVTRKINIWTLC